MKKWMLILLSLLLVAAAVGCSKNTVPAPGIVTPGAVLEDAADDGGEDAHEVRPAPLPEENSGNSDKQVVDDREPAKPSENEDIEEMPKAEDTTAKDEDNSGKDEGGKTPDSSDNVIDGGLWDGGPVTWELTSDGVLTIEGNRSVQAKQKYPWWNYADMVTKVVIGEGITNVPENIFSNMYCLAEVSLSNTVKTIDEGAFLNCTALTTITIPASVTDIGLGAFAGCSNLHNISFTSGGTGLTIGELAFNRAGLTSFTAPSHLRTISTRAFTNCTQLQSIRLEGGITTVMARAFEGCTALQHLVLGQSITETYGLIFNDCNAITTIENRSSCFDEFTHLPNLTTVVVGGSRTTTGRFSYCPQLQNVTIGGSITKISDIAFSNCPALTSITIPNTVTTIGQSAFDGTGLVSITIPASVTSMESFLFSRTPLREITFTGDAPEMSAANNTFHEKTLTAYYPADNPTWTAEVLQNYGGTITWGAR